MKPISKQTLGRALLALAVALFGAGPLAAPALGKAGPKKHAKRHHRTASRPALDRIKHFVIVYEENHSFDNLYGGWEGVNGISHADTGHTIQVNTAGSPFTCLMQNDVNLASPPLPRACTDATTGTSFSSVFSNAPFNIGVYIPPSAKTCPAPGASAPHGVASGAGDPGGCTEDLVHRYYQEQYQLDHGRQDRYVIGSDAVGLTMGHYDTTRLPIYAYLHQRGHPRYAIADNFFQAAFGGSFLNHQWLIAAQTPTFANAVNDGGANDLHSVVDANGMPNNYPLYQSPAGSSVKDQALTASCVPAAGRGPTPPGVTCGDFAVNTIQPPYQPFAPGTADAKKLPPLTTPNIGDRLTAAGVDWAWYAGGWSNADGEIGAPGWTNGTAPAAPTAKSPAPCSDPYSDPAAVFPNCPDKNFQYHHQPFNYYANLAPGTQARKQHLRDEQEFLSLAQSSGACALKPVSFVKPIGEQNEHPGYASESTGSDHLIQLLNAVEDGPCARDTLVIVTYDEFGGQWDHVSPPGQGSASGPHDKWGPGTRVPALLVSRLLPRTFGVDHTQHDTTSILATLEHRFGVAPLGPRDAAVKDLSSPFAAGKHRHHARKRRKRSRSKG